ncbi:hypothetical protein JB92DRAFT_2846877 [Gautieria morchelliformis]|nr:hypothetical protein JB92DRAFT_2846877 [Gautieria morchelliformis]
MTTTAQMTVALFCCLVTLFRMGVSEAAWLPRADSADLLRRQTGLPAAIPSQCSSICTPALMALQACNPPMVSCFCAPSLQSGLFNCYSCAGQAGNSTDYSTPQMQIDEITATCDQVGMPLPIRTFPGQNPNRTLVTTATSLSQTSTQRGSTALTTAGTATTASSVISSASIQTFSPLSVGTAVGAGSMTAPSTSSTTSPSAPTTTTGNGAHRGDLPMWMVTTGVFLVACFLT